MKTQTPPLNVELQSVPIAENHDFSECIAINILCISEIKLDIPNQLYSNALP